MGKEGSATGRWDLSSLNATAEEHYLSCDATGFIKDLVAIPFSGHATSGMSWDENTDQTHWHWIGKVHNFLETEFLDEIDLNNDIWEPGYVASESGGTSKAETIYLRRTDLGNKKLIGVIMNRSWNWFTIGEGGPCDEIPIDGDTQDFTTLPEFMMEFGNCGDSNEPLKIESMGILNDYRIRYYDPTNLDIIEDVVKNTGLDGKLRLENYALLTLNRPFVFFKAWRDQEGEQFMPPVSPETSDIYAQKGNTKVHHSHMDSEYSTLLKQNLSNGKIRLWPNPSSGLLTIEITADHEETIEIYNTLGQLIQTCTEHWTYELDITSWPAGIYLVRCPGIQIEAKFVKL